MASHPRHRSHAYRALVWPNLRAAAAKKDKAARRLKTLDVAQADQEALLDSEVAVSMSLASAVFRFQSSVSRPAYPIKLFEPDENISSFRSALLPDDPGGFELIHDSRRTAIADA